MARAMFQNNSRKLWQEVKKIREQSYCIADAIGELNSAYCILTNIQKCITLLDIIQ